MKFKYLFLVAAATIMMQSCGGNSSNSNATNDSTAAAPAASANNAPAQPAVEPTNVVAALPKLTEHKFGVKDLNCGLHFDVVNGEVYNDDKTLSIKDNKLDIAGWAIDMDNMRPMSHLYAEVNGKVYEVKTDMERADVRDAFKLTFANIGFIMSIPTDGLEMGSSIKFYMEGEKEDFLCEPIEYKIIKK